MFCLIFQDYKTNYNNAGMTSERLECINQSQWLYSLSEIGYFYNLILAEKHITRRSRVHNLWAFFIWIKHSIQNKHYYPDGQLLSLREQEVSTDEPKTSERLA